MDSAGFEMGDIMVAKGDPLYVWSNSAFASEYGDPKEAEYIYWDSRPLG